MVQAWAVARSPAPSAAAAAVREHRRLAREAYERIRGFLRDHDVQFNGAGEEGITIEQAWNVEHTKKAVRDANLATIQGIADICRDYRTIRVQVHGETGRAASAPLPLAAHLKLDPLEDVAACMDHLAQCRARACAEALVVHGVPEEQLVLQWDGMGGRVRVDFVPEGLDAPDDEPPELFDQGSPKQYLHREYRRTTIRAHGPRHVPPRQMPSLRNVVLPWAEGDLAIAVTKFPRLEWPEVLQKWLRRVGGGQEFEVFARLFAGSRDAGQPFSAGSHAQYAGISLADLLHFDTSRLSKLGVCSVLKARELSAEAETVRRVVTSDQMYSGTERWRGPLMPDWLWELLSARQGDEASQP